MLKPISLLSTDNPNLQGKALEAANKLLRIEEDISKVEKNVVIEERGMRYVFGPNVGCEICGGICDDCETEEPFFYAVCNALGRSSNCISATKITQEPRIYGPHNAEEAKKLVGKTVEFWDGSWSKWTLEEVTAMEIYEPYLVKGRGSFSTIREIPKIQMTLTEAKAKYFPDNVEIVEG